MLKFSKVGGLIIKIRQFMDEEQKNDLLEEFDLKDLPKDVQAAILQAMTETLLKKISISILEKLSEEEREEFEKVREMEDAVKTESFLREKIEDYDALVEGVSNEFKHEMKEHIDELKKELRQ